MKYLKIMLIMKLYDDSKENFHTMFKMYKVAEDNNNEIIDVNSKVYDIITWKNYTSKYFDVCFDNEEYDAYTSHFIDNYKTTVSLIDPLSGSITIWLCPNTLAAFLRLLRVD